MRSPLGRLVILACAGLIFLAAAQAPSQPGDILEHTRAAYAALHSYADTGVTTTEYRSPGAPAMVERHTFSTLYKSPRQYLFDFQKDPKAGAERFVIWGDGEDFHTWWSATRVHDTYPRGRGATAFALGSSPTKGTVLLLAPLLFPQAVDAIGATANLLSSEVWWTPRHPFTSSLTGETCQQIADSYTKASGQQWTQPLLHYGVFEVVVDALKRCQNIDSKQAIVDAISTTKMTTLAGPCDFTTPPALGTMHPVKNVYKTPLVGGQWIKGTTYPFDLVIVDNVLAPEIKVEAAFQLIAY